MTNLVSQTSCRRDAPWGSIGRDPTGSLAGGGGNGGVDRSSSCCDATTGDSAGPRTSAVARTAGPLSVESAPAPAVGAPHPPQNAPTSRVPHRGQKFTPTMPFTLRRHVDGGSLARRLAKPSPGSPKGQPFRGALLFMPTPAPRARPTRIW
jgi:hypothetical protein